MRGVDVLEHLELIGSEQHGLVTTSQAKHAGIPRIWLSRLAGQGILQRLRQGVYALPSARDDTLQELRAAWMSASLNVHGGNESGSDTPVVASHSTAAAVHHISDLVPSKFEFTYPSLFQTTQPDIAFHRSKLSTDEISWVEGLPVTSITRTVADLSKAYVDFDHISEIISSAHRRGVGKEALISALSKTAQRDGMPDARKLVHLATSDIAPLGAERLADFFISKIGLSVSEADHLLQQLSTETLNLLHERMDTVPDANPR